LLPFRNRLSPSACALRFVQTGKTYTQQKVVAAVLAEEIKKRGTSATELANLVVLRVDASELRKASCAWDVTHTTQRLVRLFWT
jgi:hypothetical protein